MADMEGKISKEIDIAEAKAIDSLSRYKFQMFGYWAGIWVHINRISGEKRPNPFTDLVKLARKRKSEKPLMEKKQQLPGISVLKPKDLARAERKQP